MASLLAATGGFVDAHTFLARGGVLAGAQTGNIILLAAAAGGGDVAKALSHVPSIFAFMVGVLLTEVMAGDRVRRLLRRPVRVVLLLQVVVLVAVGFIPQAPDISVTNSLTGAAVAFAAAMQFSVFRSVRGLSYTSTFASGNLRSFIEATYRWARGRGGPTGGRQVGDLGAVLLSFITGAVIGGFATDAWGVRAIWVAPVVLLAVLALLVVETRHLERA